MIFTLTESPVGTLVIWGDGLSLRGVGMATSPSPGWERDHTSGVLNEACRQLRQYFAGERREFDLPLSPGGTPFQHRVWAELRRIRYGETISYGELARRVGNPRASRAVGAANGRNPIAIIVPCHRVIGGNGSMTGFGGGIERKRALLELEGAGRGLLIPGCA